MPTETLVSLPSNTHAAVSEFNETYELIVRRIPVIEDRKKLFLDLAWRNEAEHGV
jgi:hypothetical protein